MAHFSEKSCFDFLTKKDQQDLYKLLGCDELNTKEQINSEFKRKALQFHPDKHRKKEDDDKVELPHKIFERLKKARDILCDDSSRRHYDYWRRSGLQDYITFDEWLGKSSHMQASIHWAPKVAKKHMLADTEHDHNLCKEMKEQDESDTTRAIRKYHPYARSGWGVRKSHLIRKFQNYEI